MKTAEELLLKHVGKLALSGLKWKTLNERKHLILKAMEEYASQFKACGVNQSSEVPKTSQTCRAYSSGTNIERCNCKSGDECPFHV